MSKILKSFGMAALLVALLAGTGMADLTDETVVSGNVPVTYSITAPAAIDLGTLNVGAAKNVTTDGTTNVHLSVETNGQVTLQALENEGDGLMASGVNTLEKPLTIKAGGETAISLSGTEQAVKTLSATNTSIVTDFGQYVVAGDIPGAYTITVLFQGATG